MGRHQMEDSKWRCWAQTPRAVAPIYGIPLNSRSEYKVCEEQADILAMNDEQSIPFGPGHPQYLEARALALSIAAIRKAQAKEIRSISWWVHPTGSAQVKISRAMSCAYLAANKLGRKLNAVTRARPLAARLAHRSMPMTHPVHVMRIQPALPALPVIAAIATMMRGNPQRHAHHCHDQRSEQVSHHRFSHEILRRGRDRNYRQWL
jgi:hypothetical protein